MNIEGYEFNGPYSLWQTALDKAGIYIIVNAQNQVVDVGQSGEVGQRLDTHDRSDCWKRNQAKGYFVMYMPTSGYSLQDRLTTEKILRDKYHPSCGLR